jgi:Tfp pilus assembly protein PilF
MRSLGLLYHQPLVHFHLGLALAASGSIDGAIKSVHTALELRPEMAGAHEVLAKLYRSKGDAAKGHFHQHRAQQLRKDQPEQSAPDPQP